MIVEVPLQLWALPGKPSAGRPARGACRGLRRRARSSRCASRCEEARGGVATLDPEALNGTNRMRLFVFGNDRRAQARLVALLDNLGKGASGAAVQNLNLMLGLEEARGL